jgi:hypothetical protein
VAVADFEVLYGHLLGTLRESTEIRIPSLYLNHKHPEFEAGESATGPRCSGVGWSRGLSRVCCVGPRCCEFVHALKPKGTSAPVLSLS